MTVPFRTFALFGLAFGMLAAGYLFAPARGAGESVPAPAVAVAKAEPPALARQPVPTLVANRPPVPLVTAPRTSFFQQAKAEQPAGPLPSDKPSTDTGTSTGTSNSNQPDADAPAQALVTPGDDAPARRAIEFDGYRNVRSLVKGPDGNWHGRALRGRTEVAVRVDATGNVSAE
jgi:hypothetical protein